jgi:hypothetical protein
VQVHCDEGVAIRIGPEPCAGIREGVGEASVGERAGQPLSCESPKSRVPTALTFRKAIRLSTLRECPVDSAWSETLACTEAPCTGTGRSLDWPPNPTYGWMVRSGKARSRSR